MTWGISFDKISVSQDCCITRLWHSINKNYVFNPSNNQINTEPGFYGLLNITPLSIRPNEEMSDDDDDDNDDENENKTQERTRTLTCSALPST